MCTRRSRRRSRRKSRFHIVAGDSRRGKYDKQSHKYSPSNPCAGKADGTRPKDCKAGRPICKQNICAIDDKDFTEKLKRKARKAKRVSTDERLHEWSRKHMPDPHQRLKEHQAEQLREREKAAAKARTKTKAWKAAKLVLARGEHAKAEGRAALSRLPPSSPLRRKKADPKRWVFWKKTQPRAQTSATHLKSAASIPPEYAATVRAAAKRREEKAEGAAHSTPESKSRADFDWLAGHRQPVEIAVKSEKHKADMARIRARKEASEAKTRRENLADIKSKKSRKLWEHPWIHGKSRHSSSKKSKKSWSKAATGARKSLSKGIKGTGDSIGSASSALPSIDDMSTHYDKKKKQYGDPKDKAKKVGNAWMDTMEFFFKGMGSLGSALGKVFTQILEADFTTDAKKTAKQQKLMHQHRESSARRKEEADKEERDKERAHALEMKKLDKNSHSSQRSGRGHLGYGHSGHGSGYWDY